MLAIENEETISEKLTPYWAAFVIIVTLLTLFV